MLLTAGIVGNDYTMADGKITYTELGPSTARTTAHPCPISKKFDLAVLGARTPGFLESVASASAPTSPSPDGIRQRHARRARVLRHGGEVDDRVLHRRQGPQRPA